MSKDIKCFHCKEVIDGKVLVDNNFKGDRYLHENCKDEYLSKQVVKCKWCGEKSVYKFSSIDSNGESSKKEDGYFHEECYGYFLSDKEFKEKEAQELDELNDYLLQLFNVKFFNHGVYTILASIRNGDSGVLGGKAVKSKEGYSYSLILESFKYCIDDIEYALRKKNFNGVNHALKYILYIVTDKLPMLARAKEHREEERRIQDIQANKFDDIELDDYEEDFENIKKETRPKFFD